MEHPILLEAFLNYQQNKFDISANYFFLIVMVSHKFGGVFYLLM